MNWITDDRGNKCSVEYFGSVESAQAALDSLINCVDCINCYDCTGCHRCYHCFDCSGCSDCSYCSDCSDCSECSGCSYVAHLTDHKNINGELGINFGLIEPPPIPVIENIHQKVYEAASQPQALDMSTWHRCNTTHCRAGWVVHLAGDAGYALERFHNTLLAAQLIYRASGYVINPCRFFDSDEAALADMASLAKAGAA